MKLLWGTIYALMIVDLFLFCRPLGIGAMIYALILAVFNEQEQAAL